MKNYRNVGGNGVKWFYNLGIIPKIRISFLVLVIMIGVIGSIAVQLLVTEIDPTVQKVAVLLASGTGDNVRMAQTMTMTISAMVDKAILYMVGTSLLSLGLGIYFSIFFSNHIGKPIQKIICAAGCVAEGNLDIKRTITTEDEVGDMARALEKIVVVLKSLILDSERLAYAGREGKLDIRIDASKHNGEYRKIVEGINHTLDAVMAPIGEVASVLKDMANGNVHMRVTGDYQGEYADMKDAMNETLDTIAGYVGELTEVLSQMSKANLDLVINKEYKGDFAQIKDAVNLICTSVSKVFRDINHAAELVASGAKQVSDSGQVLSQGATEQERVIEELTVSIRQVARQTQDSVTKANQARDLAVAAKDKAEQGNSHMNRMLESMENMNLSSTKISKIIKVIDEIAFQTNILALNAAVEAARAGQHGKGFAVVAEEVRNLAARSANAAKETTELIEGSIKNVENGTKIAMGTASALGEIVGGATMAVGIGADNAVAFNEQAVAVTQIHKGIEEVAQVVQNNAATAQESAATSEELSGQAEILKNMISKFKLQKDNGYLA